MAKAKPTTEEYRAQLEEAKLASTAQLLFVCARRVNERALARAPRAPDGRAVRQAHTALFPHVTLEGVRITELAAKLGVSKQAVGQLVDELVAMGMFERLDDPTDARAKLVRWTAKGRRGLLQGLGLLRELESELEVALGARAWKGLREGLLALHAHLDAREKEGAPTS